MESRVPLIALFFLAGAVAWPAGAHAREVITVGFYAPTLPFAGPEIRFELVSALAEHLGPAAKGSRVVGRVFARASDLQAAVRDREIQYAVIDAPYVAALGNPYKIHATLQLGGGASTRWLLVAKSEIRSLADLRGKTVVSPGIGARESQFVTRVLLEGEVGPSYFGRLITAPDAYSAATMLGLDRAAAAFVPAGTTLPAGVAPVLELRAIALPVFVSFPGTDEELTRRMAALVVSFRSGVVQGFSATAVAQRHDELAGAFGDRRRRGPLAVPPSARVDTKGLFTRHRPALPLLPIEGFLSEPRPASK